VRYLFLVHDGAATENPARALISDRPLVITVILWVCAVIGLLYLL
jgi:hypothetical protein